MVSANIFGVEWTRFSVYKDLNIKSEKSLFELDVEDTVTGKTYFQSHIFLVASAKFELFLLLRRKKNEKE